MKKINAFTIALVILISTSFISSCGSQKTNPEEAVREYAKELVEKIKLNQTDSIVASFPDLAKADSLITIKGDSIIVEESTPGSYRVTLMDGVILMVNRGEDGTVRVEQSQGLFAYPEHKTQLAKKTGMWSDSITDAQLADRMKDEEFFTYIAKTAKDKKSRLLKISGGKVTNISDMTIDGSDFSVIKQFATRGDYFSRGNVKYSNVKGKTLAPGESMHISLVQALMGWESLTGIKWNISDDDFVARYVNFAGNEYAEYQKNKSNKN